MARAFIALTSLAAITRGDFSMPRRARVDPRPWTSLWSDARAGANSAEHAHARARARAAATWFTPTQDGGLNAPQNSPRFKNRPLYGDHDSSLVLAGDLPVVHLADDRTLYGGALLGLVGPSGGVWLQRASNVQATFYPGRMQWVVSDEQFPGVQVTVTAAPGGGFKGSAISADIVVAANASAAGLRFVWAFGCGTAPASSNPLGWLYDPLIHPDVVTWEFTPGDCAGNSVTVMDAGAGTISFSASGQAHSVVVQTAANASTIAGVTDATNWSNITEIVNVSSPALPMLYGSVDASASVSVALVVTVDAAGVGAQTGMQMASARVERLAGRVQTKTPDMLFDFAVQAMSFAVDGLWRNDPPVFVHGAMAWDVTYVGWRSEFGGTIYGDSELVALEGDTMVAHQNQVAGATECQSDPTKLLTQESQNSRFYGQGRINWAAGMYDMQSQMFDQQIHMWRWTGNVTHEAILRPGLQLHAAWAHDCFDADGNGLYQSYINTWPTDSVFYSGGETYEETAYMFRTHAALRDMALRAGNTTEAAQHAALMATIQQNLPSLWINDTGHPSAFREELGHQRLRSDAWLYSVFLPIDAQLFSLEEAAQALYYTEWGLERDAVYCDPSLTTVCGEVVWTSNWVPSQWSVRQLWPGDMHALAQAYFSTGLPDDGYRVLSGALMMQMTQGIVPGQAGGANGGTDFNDCVHPLARVLVEGLFGYQPDYINGTVTIAPQFPSSWPSAELNAPYATLTFNTQPATVLNCTLSQAVPTIVVRLPLRVASFDLSQLSVSSTPAGASWSASIVTGIGQSVLVVSVRATSGGLTGAAVTVQTSQALQYIPSISMNVTAGAPLTVSPPQQGMEVVSFSDPQGVFVPGTTVIKSGVLTGQLSQTLQGYHMIIVYVNTTAASPLQQALLVKLNASSPAWNALVPIAPDAKWMYVPMQPYLNADMTHMFDVGTYLSPRPETCGVRIGTDGWSAWTFPWWNGPAAPAPTFSLLSNISIGNGIVQTPQGAQFALNVSAGQRNIAFTSLWTNYNATLNVSIPAAPNATAAWVLLAGSTNPMQTLLTNAVLRYLYTDGTVEELELVPPMNYWSLNGWGTADYSYSTDAFCLPPTPPPTVWLGTSNRAMVYSHALKAGSTLATVQLETLSTEIVVGILAVSLTA